MSRKDLLNKIHRYAKKTLLMYGEGLCEEVFLRHLKGLYSCKKGVVITIRKGRGSNAKNIVIDAHKVPGAFNRRVVVLDNDKSEQEMSNARQEAKNRGIELFENTPCLESLLLSIVDRKPVGKSSNWCKREFESKYIDHERRCDSKEYEKMFQRERLDRQRGKIEELNKLLNIMEGIG